MFEGMRFRSGKDGVGIRKGEVYIVTGIHFATSFGTYAEMVCENDGSVRYVNQTEWAKLKEVNRVRDK